MGGRIRGAIQSTHTIRYDTIVSTVIRCDLPQQRLSELRMFKHPKVVSFHIY